MSRPPPIPLRDPSPRGQRGISPARGGDNNNNAVAAAAAAEDTATATATTDGRPPPAPPIHGTPGTNPTTTRHTFPIRHTAMVHSLPPSPGAGDMEELLRNWGATSTDVNNDLGMVGMVGGNIRNGWLSTSTGLGLDEGMDSLRIDRSASFDDDPRVNNANAAGGNSAANAAVSARNHRRIGSTGGTRVAIDVATSAMIPQVLERMDTPAVDGDLILNGVGLSALHDAARITDWNAVAELSQTNPESARYVGPDGWNALHHACDRRCPHVEVIDSLLSAYPEALVQTNDKGWTPLHRACRNKTPRDVVRLLLRKYPELGKRAAGMRCNDGRSSLHYALLYDAPEGVVDLLLQADPGAVLDEDRDGVSPLGTVWDKYANSFDGRRTLQILLRPFEGEGWELGGNENNADEGERELNRRSEREIAERRVRETMEKQVPACKQLKAKWLKASTLLRAYFHFPLQDERSEEDDSSSNAISEGSPSAPRKRKWRILHATSAIKCHPHLFLLARALHPEEAQEVDENDLFGGGRDVMNTSPDPQSPNAEIQRMSQRSALHFAAMSPLSGREGRNVIKVLLKLNPNAASHVDGYGSLPLHLISQNDRKLQYSNEGVRDVYNAHPAASSCRDGFGRTPLHCAASSAKHCTQSTSLPGGPAPVPPAIVPTHAEACVIENLVGVDRTAASMADNTGRLPLHYIAEHGEEWNDQAQSLLDAHPAAVQTRAGPSTSNQLPLHMAAGSPDARPSMIMNLVNANPRAASMMDGMGRLPLHLAVDSGRTTWDRGIDSIYQAYNAAISIPEESPRRWMVLHTATASHSAGHELIERILELNQNAASVADGEGKSPLHLACAANRPWEEGGVKLIFDADPAVALLDDANGLLPFHIAAMRSSVPAHSTDDDSENEIPGSVPARGDADNDDLESLEVLFNLLIAQPSIVQL
ncbi:hypothetical protein ACHAXR_012227 [Thalassiosira sp. AJA248-18]